MQDSCDFKISNSAAIKRVKGSRQNDRLCRRKQGTLLHHRSVYQGSVRFRQSNLRFRIRIGDAGLVRFQDFKFRSDLWVKGGLALLASLAGMSGGPG
jgi:hypothetical protein